MSSMQRPPQDSWDYMLPGPPSRNNGGSADLRSTGLLAYAAGSSVAIVDSRSMQLVTVLPIPPPSVGAGNSTTTSSSSSLLSPFVTAVRWCPTPLRLDLLSHDPTSSHSHLLLAAGDRQGRICLLDPRVKSSAPLFLQTDTNTKLGIQDLCWIQARPDSWIIAAITGSSLLSLFETSTGRCFFKYDAAPETFSCIKRDPFDSRHFCVVGLRGFLLAIKVHGDNSESDIVLKELQIPTDVSELNKLERDAAAGASASGTMNNSPAMALFPTYTVKIAFSPHWRHILYVTFPRELIVFDMQYQTALSRASLPRGCGKFLDVLPDPSLEMVYCAHFDGRLTAWRRKEGEQVHVMCMMEELMPSLGTPVPSPSVLAVVISQSDSTLQNVRKHLNDGHHASSSDMEFDMDFDNPFDFCDESHVISRTHLLSISDDGKIWNWLLTAEGLTENKKDTSNVGVVAEISKDPVLDTNADEGAQSSFDSVKDVVKQIDKENIRKGNPSVSIRSTDELALKISLVGQLHLLSSSVTMLAVPSPSLTATLARGGNQPAVAVPLVALGTQSGSVDIVDVSANAVAASFAIHDSVVRGLRWLGNTRLVSFSYSQGNEKTGGYTNRLVVTCLRTGLNRTFRVLQKPERTPIRALRASSSGRYLLILFRDAPVEVWAMTKTPIMLRSLALPFTVLEWTLPTVPRPQSGASKQSDASVPPDGMASQTDSKAVSSDGAQEEFSESFAFALVNGALGVFEVQGRRIRDFKPKWPTSSLVSSDGPVRAMAYRLPHVVMGDRSGNIRWWDVTTGQSSSFNTHREGIRRIKFSPVVPGDRSRGRIAVLFNDNTFSVFDLDSPDPLANSLLQPQFPGTLVLELDWLPVRTDINDPLVLCITGADSSFRLVEVNVDKRVGYGSQSGFMKERFRPMPLCSPILLPTAHALALRLILQCGVKPSWFNTLSTIINKEHSQLSRTTSSVGDLRSYLIDIPIIGDSVVPELLLKVLEPYQREGCILDDERVRQYATILNKGSAARFSFAAAIFGETSEAYFWLQLPHALKHLMNNLANKSLQKAPVKSSSSEIDDVSLLSRISSKGKSESGPRKRNAVSDGELRLMAFEQEELWENASERIPWHERLEDEEAIQNRVHELVSIGNLEAAVSLMLSTPPESPYFYPNALRAVALSSAVSRSLNELAVKVVAANMVRTDRSLSGTHLLCAVGRYQEACSQLQDAGCWTDAATLAATHLKGTDYARVLHRWAEHVLHAEHNIWRALVLYIAAGSLQDALAALREAQQPDTAAMFIIACREIHAEFIKSSLEDSVSDSYSSLKEKLVVLNPENEDVIAVGELYGQFQQKLVHLCMDSQPFLD
ncbi:WD repeat-containing protein 11-like [Cynara cardunculus var. scolymus]|uniref:WD repeat-containing protein 11-like n=1 Tax=Cynara cardunculus var. scolymus TaxID=59895 RepID=UPI000D626140|nr:WD repeat-containing protein 11-like [Cynara cardunculus var. scolymus]